MFHVLGAGSLGLLWAARLAGAGFEPRIILRDQTALAAWRAAGSRIALQERDDVRWFSVSAELAAACSPIDRLIVATKAYSVVDALRSVADRLHRGSEVLLLQNGLGSQQHACQLLPQHRLLFASVTDGAWLADRQTLVWAGKGMTRIGDPNGRPEPEWFDLLLSHGFACQWEAEILPVLWEKLAINCVINPFTALHNCPNGSVPTVAGDRLPMLVSELQTLLFKQGMASVALRLPDTLADVIQRTAANSSSMRQDLAAGRQTEIDYMLGFACRSAREAGLQLAELERLYAALQALLVSRGLPAD